MILFCQLLYLLIRERDELQKEMDTIRRTLIEKEISEKIKQEESQKVHDEVNSHNCYHNSYYTWHTCTLLSKNL